MGLLRTAARAAVATRVVGSVHRRQQQRWAAQDQAAAQQAAAAAPPPAPVAAPEPAPAAAAPAPDLLDQLAKLGELRAAGVLTEEEFAAQKQRVLGGA